MSRRILVAGIGNIFFGDDAFGPSVLARLCATPPPAGVTWQDYGIGVIHLAFELLAGYDAAIIVDAASSGGPPGTLYVLEPSPPPADVVPDAHRMDIASVFAFVHRLGGQPPPITVVGCEPVCLDEGAELSAPVAAAVEAAVPLVRRIIDDLLAHAEETVCSEA